MSQNKAKPTSTNLKTNESDSIVARVSLNENRVDEALRLKMESPKFGGKKSYSKDRVSDDGFIYTPYIVVRGKIIWHPTGGVFRFLPKE